MKNLHFSLPAVTLLPAQSLQTGAKLGLILFTFIWLPACSQSPAPNGSTQPSTSVLTDSSAVLGSSPDYAYRLFKGTRQVDGQTVTDLKLLRLKDLHETLVATLSAEAPAQEVTSGAAPGPKLYWSKDSKYLLVDNSVKDSTYEREVVLFDLQNLSVAQRNPGQLLGYDLVHDVVFYYRTSAVRQSICFYYLENPAKESVRDVIAVPAGKLPGLILLSKEKQARVKAYSTGDTPVNFAIFY